MIQRHIITVILIGLLIILLYMYNKNNTNNNENFNNPNINTITNNALDNISNTYEKTNITFNNLINTNQINAKQLVASNMKGIIVAWSGTTENIPSGWGLCDGTTYTDLSGNSIKSPDLRSVFIVGASKDNTPNLTSLTNTNDQSSIIRTPKKVYDISGEETHTLQINEIPAHQHNLPISGGYLNCSSFICIPQPCPTNTNTTNGNYLDNGNGCWGYYTDVIQNTGGNSSGNANPHSNMPPYYAFAYIIKIF